VPWQSTRNKLESTAVTIWHYMSFYDLIFWKLSWLLDFVTVVGSFQP